MRQQGEGKLQLERETERTGETCREKGRSMLCKGEEERETRFYCPHKSLLESASLID